MAMSTITVSSSSTNDSFAEEVCAQVADAGFNGVLEITGTPCLNLILPSCISQYALNSITIQTCIIIESFAIFPPSIISVTIKESSFLMNESFTLPAPIAPSTEPAPSPSAPTPSFNSSLNGFDADGNVDWDEVFTLLPVLITLTISDCDLRGPLPSAIPASLLAGFDLSNNELSGTIPASLFSLTADYNSYSFYLSGNSLTGTIPESLFEPFRGRKMSTILFSMKNNELSGPIPSQLLQPFANTNGSSFELDLSANQLNGSITDFLPENLIDNNATGASTVRLILSSNQLTGSLPASFLANMPVASTLTFYVDDNKLTGSLPSSVFPNGWYEIGSGIMGAYLNFSANGFTGSIPSTLLGTDTLTQNLTLNALVLSFDDNKLDTLPDSLFYRYLTATEFVAISVSGSLQISMKNNAFSGAFPSTMLSHAGTTGTQIQLTLSNNRISGAFPTDAFADLSSSIGSNIVLASNNSFASLPECSPGLSYYDFANNALSSTIPSSYAACSLIALFVTDNPVLTGSIPPGFLSSPTLVYLAASNSGLSGDLLTNFSATTQTVDLSGTDIDFCSSATLAAGFSTYTASCNLNDTSACQCATSYAMCSTNACPPVEPVAPVTPPTNAPSSPSATPTGCPSGTRPTSEFTCVNGGWTAPSTTAPVLTIPSGAGSVLVTGNVSSSAIVIDGLGTTITIGGCASNLTQVVLELDAETIKKLASKTLQPLVVLSASATACTNLSSVALSTKLTSSTCKSIKSEKVLSTDGGTLSALFTVSSSGCNTWWIILVSVLVAVVIIGAVIAVAVAMIWNRKKAKRNTKTLAKARASVRG